MTIQFACIIEECKFERPSETKIDTTRFKQFPSVRKTSTLVSTQLDNELSD